MTDFTYRSSHVYVGSKTSYDGEPWTSACSCGWKKGAKNRDHSRDTFGHHKKEYPPKESNSPKKERLIIPQRTVLSNNKFRSESEEDLDALLNMHDKAGFILDLATLNSIATDDSAEIEAYFNIKYPKFFTRFKQLIEKNAERIVEEGNKPRKSPQLSLKFDQKVSTNVPRTV